jgi:hypothetical protein
MKKITISIFLFWLFLSFLSASTDFTYSLGAATECVAIAVEGIIFACHDDPGTAGPPRLVVIDGSNGVLLRSYNGVDGDNMRHLIAYKDPDITYITIYVGTSVGRLYKFRYYKSTNTLSLDSNWTTANPISLGSGVTAPPGRGYTDPVWTVDIIFIPCGNNLHARLETNGNAYPGWGSNNPRTLPDGEAIQGCPAVYMDKYIYAGTTAGTSDGGRVLKIDCSDGSIDGTYPSLGNDLANGEFTAHPYLRYYGGANNATIYIGTANASSDSGLYAIRASSMNLVASYEYGGNGSNNDRITGSAFSGQVPYGYDSWVYYGLFNASALIKLFHDYNDTTGAHISLNIVTNYPFTGFSGDVVTNVLSIDGTTTMCFGTSNRQLCRITTSGTPGMVDGYPKSCGNSGSLNGIAYDRINNHIIVTNDNGTIYAFAP